MVTAKIVAPTTALVAPLSSALLTSATAAITATIAPAAWLTLLALSSPGVCSRSLRRIRLSASHRRVMRQSYRAGEAPRCHGPSGPRQDPRGRCRRQPVRAVRGIDLGDESGGQG